MSNFSSAICEFCRIGYHAPFERFEIIATTEDGPAFLMKCKICGVLWYESLHSVRRVTPAEALSLYPEIEL